MFFEQLLFSSILVTLTIAYNLYSTIDYSTNMKYECMYIYLSSDIFQKVIFSQTGINPEGRFIDELTKYCLPEEHHIINEKSCIANGGIIWTFAQLQEQNITSIDFINWNATINVIDKYEHYLQTGKPESSILSFCNCTNGSYFGTQCQYEFDMANISFWNILISHFRNLGARDLGDIDDVDVLENDASVTCYKRDASCFGACLDWRQICNRIVDCQDGWDEVSCHLLEFNECENNEYRCRSGHCIPMLFAFDEIFDCADGSDEDGHFPVSFDLEKCYKKVPNLFCDESNDAWMKFPCGDGEVLRDILHGCGNGRLVRTVKMLYTSEVTLCWQYLVCVMYLDSYFSSLVNCSVLCGEHHDCSSMLPSVCDEKIVLFPSRPIVSGTSIYFAYFTNTTYLDLPDFICYSECDHLYPPSLNINGHSCRSINEFLDKYIDRNKLDENYFPEILSLFNGCRNRAEISNNSLIFRCPIGGKLISFHRVQDSFIDCPFAFDESFNGSTCIENSTQRIQCWTISNKCIHRRFIQDGHDDCPDESDEFRPGVCLKGEGPLCEYRRGFNQAINIHYEFQQLCDGLTTHSYLSGVLNGTDETDCEDFRCLSSHSTRCNGFWDCKDGHDELNCSLDILPAKAKSTKLLHSLHGCDTMEHFCVHFPNRSHGLTRPCIPVTYAGDGQIDCYGATDERLSVCYYTNTEYEFLKNYRCVGEKNTCIRLANVCDGESTCPLEDDETVCSWFPKNSKFSLFYCLNGSIFYRAVVHCNGKLDCASGEDEWFCDLAIPAPALIDSGQIYIPAYPPGLQNTSEQMTVRRQALILVTLKKKSSWYCNRGLPITVGRRQRCLCPSSYYGERCEYQRERISLILKIVSSPLLQRDIAIKCVVYLIDIDTLNILVEEEILHFPHVHGSFKHIVSLASIRAQNSFVRIDVYEVSTERVIAYRASWKFRLPFPFLPVRRLAHQLDLSSDQNFFYESRLNCHSCFHGRCLSYQNSDDVFCHCENGWTGTNCNQSLLCAPGSLSLNSYRCLCPMNRDGDRCFIPYKPVCQCQNGATCIPLNARTDQSACLCLDNYFGRYCERQHASLTITMLDKNLPKTLPLVLFHFIRLVSNGGIDTENIFLFEHVSTHRPLLIYHTNYERLPIMVLGKVYYSASIDDFRYYIVLYIPLSPFTPENWLKDGLTRLETSQQCLHVREMEIFKKPVNIFVYPYIKRIKFYLRGCFDNITRCFHDEVYLCFCPAQRNQTGTCLTYNHTREICQKSSYCLNGGLCIENRRAGIVEFACICPSCHYYGTLCQFSLGKQGLSLDALVGLEMRTGKSLSEQSIVIKLCLAILTMMIILGLIGNTLSIMTLARKKSRETGCGYYLLNVSLYNQLTLIVLGLRFMYLLNTQIVLWTNRSNSLVLCKCLEYGLIILPNLSNWLSASVSIERTYAVARGVLFDKQTSIRTAKWLCLALLIILAGITVHEPFSRQLIEDPRLGRYTWCVTKFRSERWQNLASILSIIHLVGPFLINSLSTGGLIVILTRQRSTVRKGKTIESFSTALRKQMVYYKHLIISPMVLLILNFPRLVISLGSLCVDTSWRNYVFLAGYLISFVPFTATFLIFIVPAPVYRDEFKALLSHIRLRLFTNRCLH